MVSLAPGGVAHEAGTGRMRSDPKTSMLNGFFPSLREETLFKLWGPFYHQNLTKNQQKPSWLFHGELLNTSRLKRKGESLMNRRTLVQLLVRAPLVSASGPAGDFRPKGFSVHQYRRLSLLCQQIIAADETSGAIGIRYLPSLGNRAVAEFVGCRLCQTENRPVICLAWYDIQ